MTTYRRGQAGTWQRGARCPHCGGSVVLVTKAQGGRTYQQKFDHAAARGLVRMGATVAEVADAFGVSRTSVYNALKAEA